MGARRQRWMPFRQPFSTAGERFVENTRVVVELNQFLCYFIELYKTPPQRPRPAPLDCLPRVGLGIFIESTP